MTTDQIRSKFLQFFQSRGHTIAASDSVVPKDDPTVLFTTAGMQQFKPQFMGRNLTFRRAATCQKCLRTDDLEKVGKSDVHHTFFEMLGNFSFGDYFKKEAITWAWEFFTQEFRLPAESLCVSVHNDDQEAYQIWRNDIRLPAEKIYTLGDRSNFWPANARVDGPNGPCGPCSEIFYDYGVNPECANGKSCDPDCNCGRFAEIWNLVFTQFNRRDGGVLDPLPAKNIDTGMGLERLASVLQGKKSNYETDVFTEILGSVHQHLPGIKMQEARIIADHIRAIVFGIADGVVPSNEGRGYVVRKLIVIVSDIAIRSGASQPVIYNLVDVVVKVMKNGYPELLAKAKELKAHVKAVEEQYIKIQREKVPEFKSEIGPDQSVEQLADTGFFYRDTHGLSMPVIVATMTAAQIPVNKIEAVVSGIEQKMEEQRNRSRASSKMTGDVFSDTNLKFDTPKTEFLGYEALSAQAKVLKVLQEGASVTIILDRTPFYAESGGQMGDTGVIASAQGVVKITDTQKRDDVYIHYGQIESGTIKSGDIVSAEVDVTRRESLMRNHTATHLLQSALRTLLGSHVRQQGSLVAPDRLRFDFTHPGSVKSDELQRIEQRVNELIQGAAPVATEILPLEEARQKGALAFFAEKYGQTVRVVSISDYSREFCGGTHVKNTKDIESLKILGEGSVAQGIRRIEAVTGRHNVEVLAKSKQREQELQQEAQRLKQLEKEKQNQRFQDIKSQVPQLLSQALQSHGVTVVAHVFADLGIEHLRKISDLLKQQTTSGVFLLAATTPTDGVVLITVSDDVVQRGLKANELIASTAQWMEGSGGGKPTMAQAGCKHPDKVSAALEKTKDLVSSKL